VLFCKFFSRSRAVDRWLLRSIQAFGCVPNFTIAVRLNLFEKWAVSNSGQSINSCLRVYWLTMKWASSFRSPYLVSVICIFVMLSLLGRVWIRLAISLPSLVLKRCCFVWETTYRSNVNDFLVNFIAKLHVSFIGYSFFLLNLSCQSWKYTSRRSDIFQNRYMRRETTAFFVTNHSTFRSGLLSLRLDVPRLACIAM